MKTTTELTNYARFMRNAAPQAYDDFVAVFAKYTAAAVKNMMQADSNLPQAQGQAQQAASILTALEEAKKNG